MVHDCTDIAACHALLKPTCRIKAMPRASRTTARPAGQFPRLLNGNTAACADVWRIRNAVTREPPRPQFVRRPIDHCRH